ncbi:uncharacterized protein LOC118799826 isoform X6 [Colossoma macropomum]|uniref:uncharacterized protein LOC118799826 isoform X6 n=1 Tax=Colossoma macropomum TaxID=42526 RepID=UPI0018642119|nr:uncharacterized protein LOC118799826 isoform X6 [Colossoma macropomum]
MSLNPLSNIYNHILTYFTHFCIILCNSECHLRKTSYSRNTACRSAVSNQCQCCTGWSGHLSLQKAEGCQLETLRPKVSSAIGDQGDMMAVLSVEECSPGAAGTYSLITTVAAPSQPSGSTMPIQNMDDSDPQAVTYSEITLIAAPLEPPGSTMPIQNMDDSDSQAVTYSEITSIAAPLEPPE